ncbi:MAG TPA: sugar-binding domain-containing protein [Candidatus Binatia bacterium]|jgi:DNA-binding transcriptional regulator LsrR (DeoR family)|nr:sugar-binding domain-containing protein [Candidatus Binatia bacterium]
MTKRAWHRTIHRGRTEYADMVEIARLYFDQEIPQQEIAERLHIPQATVSRLLQRAKVEGIVRHIISPPPLSRLQVDTLAKLKGRGVQEVRVVPRGVGDNADKNVKNLGDIGAEYLWEVLSQHPGERLTIGMACGDSLVSLVIRFATYLEQEPAALRELQQKEITLYPLNLFWGPKLEYGANLYPAVLVIAAATLFIKLGCKVSAYAPQPPLSFYSESEASKKREQQIADYARYLEEAKEADIFLVGIGMGIQDPKYRRLLETLNGKRHLSGSEVVGELNYQPFDDNGQFLKLPKLLAVTADELTTLAKTRKRIIAVAGGDKKVPAITALLRRISLPFNVLLTDEAVAEGILEGHR